MKKILGIILIGAAMASCSTTVPVAATNNPIGSKEGTSTTNCVFGMAGPGLLSSGIVTNKKYSIADAAKQGGISKIATVDIKTTSYIFFTKATIIVTGE